MLYILAGEDDYSLSQALEEIKKEIGDPITLPANTTVFDGPVGIDQLSPVCGAVPFLGEKRLVIIRGLLARFEPKGKSSPGKTGVSTQPDELKALGECLRTIPESTVVVLVEGKVTRKNPMFRELSAKAKVMLFPSLKEDKLRSWVLKRVREKGGSISEAAVDLLMRFVGSNLWIVANEVDKLVLFATGRRIEEEDVRQVVSYVQEANVFALVDAILEFRAGSAEELLQKLLQQGAPPAYLLVMLARQVRLMILAKELKSQRKSEAEMKDRLALSSDYALRRTLELAERYSLARLKEMHHKLLEVDLAIKTGRYEPELALNILVAELCQKQRLYSA